MRSERAERGAGLFVVLAIFFSACIASYEALDRLVHPQQVSALGALAVAGLLGFLGNAIAARIRTRAGRALDSPALVADGNHARADAYVSLAVVASAVAVALGVTWADPLIGLGITAVILKISWDSWWTVRGHDHLHQACPGFAAGPDQLGPTPAAGSRPSPLLPSFRWPASARSPTSTWTRSTRRSSCAGGRS